MFWTDEMTCFVKKKRKGYILLEGYSLSSSKGSQYVCWGTQVFSQPGAYCHTDYCTNTRVDYYFTEKIPTLIVFLRMQQYSSA